MYFCHHNRILTFKNKTMENNLFKHSANRLEAHLGKDSHEFTKDDIKQIVNTRITQSERLSSAKSSGVDVEVISHRRQRNAVWFGGSLLAQTSEFQSYCHTKADYDEYGPNIVRNFSLFSVP